MGKQLCVEIYSVSGLTHTKNPKNDKFHTELLDMNRLFNISTLKGCLCENEVSWVNNGFLIILNPLKLSSCNFHTASPIQ